MNLSKFRVMQEGSKNPTVSVEEITPELAEEYLARNTANRALSERHALGLAQRILDNEWELNGDCIRFDVEGNLIDGQHRLTAVIKAQLPIMTFVARGFAKTVFPTIDENKPRRGADVLSISEFPNSTTLAAALRLVNASGLDGGWDGWVSGSQKLSNKKVVALADEHPGCVDATLRVTKADRKNTRRLLTPAVAAFAFYWLSIIDGEDAEQFFEWLEYGDGLTRDHPVMQLRNRLIGMMQTTKGAPQKREIMALMFKAWNACRTGEDVKLLKFAQTHRFPTPV